MKFFQDGHAVKHSDDGRIFAVAGTPEDAAFILKACSNYEALVESLQDCMCEIRDRSDIKISALALLNSLRQS